MQKRRRSEHAVSAKQTPKSCSCSMCRRGKATKTGHFYRKADERAYRHNAKIELLKGSEVIRTAPTGGYYD